MAYNHQLIGDGGFGCVIQPAIDNDETKYIKKYIEYTDRKSTDVGKLFVEKDNFNSELKLLKGINEIDKEGTFTVKLKGANVFHIDMLNDDVIECLDEIGFDNDETNIHQIILEYGGKKISDVSKYSIPFKTFIQFIKPLLKGIAKLHSLKLIHQDIKPSNMLLNENKISLIDFGISEFANKLYSDKNERLSQQYKYHPPEFYIAYLLLQYKNSRSSFQTKLETVIEDLINDGRLHEIFDSSKVERVSDELADFVLEIRENDYTYDEVFNEDMAFKCDVYSLGFIFKEFHKKIIFDNQDQKYVFQKLHDMCSEINPYKRSSLQNLIDNVTKFEQNVSYDKDDQTGGGGRTKRLRFPKMYKDLSDNKSQDPPLKYKLPQIVNKHLKKK
jgi:serine/threonine protein kinase